MEIKDSIKATNEANKLTKINYTATLVFHLGFYSIIFIILAIFEHTLLWLLFLAIGVYNAVMSIMYFKLWKFYRFDENKGE